ncbi:LPXTG cell wall anchor domain-containing protein, partial [Enterococcus faecalis]|nr:LPXTG cell wall anchor domain-containing protein [Enterococcus faecalis]
DESKLPTNGTGTFKEESQTITYVYKANDKNNDGDRQKDHNNHDNQNTSNKGTTNFSNKHRSYLPHTGEKGQFSLVATVMGLMVLCTLGMIVFYRKRKK